MKVVLLYGPPAVGKLTVARALAERTGYRLLHNHLLLDLSLSLFDKGTPPGVQLSRDLRHFVVERAIDFGLPGMVLTWVYAPDREAYAEWFCRFVEERGASPTSCASTATPRRSSSASGLRSGERSTN